LKDHVKCIFFVGFFITQVKFFHSGFRKERCRVIHDIDFARSLFGLKGHIVWYFPLKEVHSGNFHRFSPIRSSHIIMAQNLSEPSDSIRFSNIRICTTLVENQKVQCRSSLISDRLLPAFTGLSEHVQQIRELISGSTLSDWL
jgi:hypothetical protein